MQDVFVLVYRIMIYLGDVLYAFSMPRFTLFRRSKGLAIGPEEENNISIAHRFFVDDLKSYVKNMDDMKQTVDLSSTFLKVIGMTFG